MLPNIILDGLVDVIIYVNHFKLVQNSIYLESIYLATMLTYCILKPSHNVQW
jgi:hypothetical protein